MQEDEEEARRLREKADTVRTRKRTQAELDALARMQVPSLPLLDPWTPWRACRKMHSCEKWQR